MGLQNWKTQLRKGLLDLCILNLLRQRKYHGYHLVQTLKKMDVFRMREGTVYPILARLAEDGLVRSETARSSAAPPWKYFTLTAAGRAYVAQANEHWNGIVEAIRQAQTGRQGEKTDG